MEIFKLCGIAVAAVVLIITTKQTRAELVPLMTIAVAVIFLSAAIKTLTPVIDAAAGIASDTLSATYAEPLIKSLGIAVMTGCAAGICRDCGESSTASAVELAGKAEILALSMPMMLELLELAKEMMP